MASFEMNSVVALDFVQEKKQKSGCRKCHENAMKPTWIWHIAALSPCHFHGTFRSLSWQIRTWLKRKVPWKCHESGMKCLESCFRGCRQSALKVLWIADSWRFQPNRAPNSFMPFTWLIHGIFMALSVNFHGYCFFSTGLYFKFWHCRSEGKTYVNWPAAFCSSSWFFVIMLATFPYAVPPST